MEERKELSPSLWTVNQAAKYLLVAPLTVYRWIAAEKIRAIRFGFGRSIRIPRTEIERIAGETRSKLMEIAEKDAAKTKKKMARMAKIAKTVKRIAVPAPVAGVKNK